MFLKSVPEKCSCGLVAVDLKPKRLDLAKRLGADLALNPAEEDVVARVKDLTDGYGCDVYIHAS
ncbi:MAG: erythritol/L-threitol dehydrogenase, partial [Candidatus Atribacteria bacterium]|nr:erythritol/L-threitol dehydrogenase [Candidatus Atribacteria bacterium]